MKVLIIQLNGNSYGGVWQVNKIVAEALVDKGYQVTILSLREHRNGIITTCNPKVNLETLNKKDLWGDNYDLNEIIAEIKKLHLIKSIKMIFVKLKHLISIKKDTKNMHKYIHTTKPDYIVTSHYQLIDMIPKDYLNKTFHEQHVSFRDSINHIGTKKVFDKYKDKLKFIWLTKKTMEDAIEYGLTNSYYIYNAVRFKSNNKANVTNNKKIITIARFAPEKRIDLMIEIVESIFKDKKYKDWTFELYGSGPDEELVKNTIKNTKQIKLMGLTDNPKEKLLTASINLNTSTKEGFALSILEANECGVPTITFDFGESVYEEIIDNKTGLIADNKEDYINKLKYLMDNSERLELLSKNSREFSKDFHIENIVKDWINLFNQEHKN